ncbi:MAG: ATP-dependent DNA helicase RecG [Thermoanaerobaculia bacterium]|nr:ATP-dependent DNA helicase RecG [Thermoanaerobaculia bacterium]
MGPQRAEILRRAGIETVRDLLDFLPFRYEDRRVVVPIVSLTPDTPTALLKGCVVAMRKRVTKLQKMELIEVAIDDGSATIDVVWFNQPFIADRIAKGDTLLVYGRPKVSPNGDLQFDPIDWERIPPDGKGELEGRIVPVYTAVGGIPQRWLRGAVAEALTTLARVADHVPELLLEGLGLPALGDALSAVHEPREFDERLVDGTSAAHSRLAFDEFFAFQLAIRARRAIMEVAPKPRTIVINDVIRSSVRRLLPFRLTGAQKRVLKEIADDMRSSRPMYRLLQGDVGSGKTIVALVAALLAIENGHQAALLAPTEILAEQHFRRIRQLVDATRIPVVRLSGSMTPAEKRATRESIATGDAKLVVGTHALVEDSVSFRSLALAIVDEQHRFGVEQRKALFEKGELVDVLVMTATPIPRSLALALHGDLDLSVIDELPPGRTPVRTVVRGSATLPRILEYIDERCAGKAQAYVVYPVIEESDRTDMKPVTTGFDAIRAALPGRRVAMLHGRLPAAEKQSTMDAFALGELDVLVSTTVIEVGIDVAAASVMVIMDADRFGLSQLHQLRGRVGRGEGESICVLVRDESSGEDAKSRLREFAATSDGFRVAEMDLAQRGAGDMAGTRQAGMARFRFGDIVRQSGLMEAARSAAIALVAERGPASALDLAARIDRRQVRLESVD